MFTRLKKAIKILINYQEKKLINTNDLLQYNRCKKWFEINGDQTLRLDYDLNPNSLIFDVGGYKGEFTSDIFCKYNSNVYVFEPVNLFYQIIQNKFSNNNKIKIFGFGLSGKDEQLQISISENSSSVYLKTEKTEMIQLKSIVDFIKKNYISQVDLIKINIEGGEYELLEALIENDLVSSFVNIQVQFHDFIIENAKERMNKIQTNLSKTHKLTYQYEFVWENWKIK
jgi:FkbM family methyltransferase